MAFPAFSARHFQQINAKENAIVSCLVYPFLVLSVKYSANEKIRVNDDAIKKVTSKGRDFYPSDGQEHQ